jgi:lipoate-protein ligase A
MSGFVEPHPSIITPNPGGPDDPLGESVLDPQQPWLRVFQPADVRVVVGRHQDPEREVHVDRARADGVPVHRRVAGGGAVVLAPGMVVVAVRLRHEVFGVSPYIDLVSGALVAGALAACGTAPVMRGLGDLAMVGADGSSRKVLGASLRQTSRMVVYLGVLLVGDAVPLMERYLRAPSREPHYRGGRDHRAFCTGLGAHGADVDGLIAAVATACRRNLAGHALDAPRDSGLGA